MVSKDTVTAIPFGRPWDKTSGTDNPTTGRPLYDDGVVVKAWRLFVQAAKAAPELRGRSTYVHDLVDVGRQVLAKHSSRVYANLSAAIDSNDTAAITSRGAVFIELLADLDTLLGAAPGFLFGRWVADSALWGVGKDEVQLMQWNAKTQVTFWEYPQPVAGAAPGTPFRASNLQDYACKQWAGLIRTYYKPRWELFINQTLATLERSPHAQLDVGAFYASMYKWFEAWRDDASLEYATDAHGDPVVLSEQYLGKYGLV